jgi:hypothetical protein
MSAEIHERQVAGIRGGRDRHGVATITLPLFAKNIAECYTLGPKTLLGMPETDRDWAEGEGGMLVVLITYSGETEGNDSSGNEAGAIGRVTYALRPTWGEEPVETHPLIKTLMQKYAGVWKDGRVIFPPDYKPGTGATGGLGRGSQTSSQRNPMFGVEKWRPVEVTWQREYAARVVPADILSRVGKVISNPPGNPPELSGRTKWLVEPVEEDDSDSGNVKRIRESYTLLPEDVPEEFYRAYSS